MLTIEQMRAREGKLTASSVACLMTGDEDKILALWHALIGDPDYRKEDLSHIWAVRLGEATEPLHLEWYQRKTGRCLSRMGEVVVSPVADWAACTLDGWDDGLNCPVEVKHVGGREARSTVIARYQPQLHWQMLVTGARQVILSMIEGAGEPVFEDIRFDAPYGAELWQRAEFFMDCVTSLTRPVSHRPQAAPIPLEALRRIDLDTLVQSHEPLPNWAHALIPELNSWQETTASAKANAEAARAIKDLIPEDVGFLRHGAVRVTRARNGALTIKLKERAR